MSRESIRSFVLHNHSKNTWKSPIRRGLVRAVAYSSASPKIRVAVELVVEAFCSACRGDPELCMRLRE